MGMFCIDGSSVFYLERYNESIQAYCKAVELAPTWCFIWENTGKSLYDKGRYDEAARIFEG